KGAWSASGTRPATPVQAREASAPDVSALAAAEGANRQPIPENRRFSLQDTSGATPAVASADPSSPAPIKTTASTTTADPDKVTLRLQGIFYRPKKPSAVINSQTVFIGNTVGGGKVIAIDRESVTLQVDGETKVLTLR